jgi:hypothetical protein
MDRKAHLWKASLAVKGQIPLLYMSRVEFEVLVMLPVRALVRHAGDQPVAALAQELRSALCQEFRLVLNRLSTA